MGILLLIRLIRCWGICVTLRVMPEFNSTWCSRVAGSKASTQDKSPCLLSSDYGMATAVLVICYVILLCSLWAYGLVDPSDGWYAEPAREMFEKHDYLTPYLNYQPFYEKPIGIYWCILFWYQIFGVHEFAARLPSAIAAVLTSAFAFQVLWSLGMKRTALLSGLTIIGSPLLVTIGHICLTDMVFTACLTTCVLSLFAYVNGLSIRYWYLGYIGLAAAVLVKGPMALLFTIAIFISYAMVHANTIRGSRATNPLQVLKCLNPLLGMLLVVAISAPWYAYEIVSSHGAFYREFVVRQHLERASGHVNHLQPWYYYLEVLGAGCAPWYMFALGYRDLKRQVFAARTTRANLIKLCALWVLVIVGAFSCSQAKLDTYVLPAVPPLAILCAVGLEYIWRFKQTRLLKALAALIFVVAIGCLIGITLSKGLWSDFNDLIRVLIPLFVFAVLPNFIVLLTKQVSRQVLVMTASYALATGLGVAFIVHAYDEVKSLPLRKMIAVVKRENGSLATFMRDSPTVVFYWGKYVPYMRTAADYQTYKRDTPAPHFVLTTDDVVPAAITACPGLTKVQESRKWWLMRTD